MGLKSKRWLKVLEGISAMQQEAWSREAVARLIDHELHLLRDALRREEPLEGEGFPQLTLDQQEQAALDRFHGFYKEARRGV